MMITITITITITIMNPNVKAKKMPNESWKRENKIKGDKE